MVYEKSIEKIMTELEKDDIHEKINKILEGVYLNDPVSYIAEALSLLKHQ